MDTIEGNFRGEGRRFALVAARFNSFVADKLVAGAVDCLRRHGVDEQDVTLVRVPGAFEIPLVAARMAKSGGFDAVVCLGAVIRGETPHFEHVAEAAAKGTLKAAEESGVPVVFGVVTADTLEQAINRAGGKSGNKGADAALAALEMANLMGSLPPEAD